jgi:predicted phosphodiesterase
MKKDFDILVYSFNDNIKIYPLSDLHYGTEGFMSEKWAEFKNRLLKEKNSYVVIAGDMINNALKSSVSNCYTDIRPSEQKQWLAKELAPIKDKILCIVSGNHENRSLKDADDSPLYDVCCKLDIEDKYRPNMAFVKIQLGKRNSDRQTYTLGVMHGSGGGIYTGGAVNRNERFGYVIDGLDCLITGHTHKPVLSRPSKMVIDTHNNKITFKPFTVITATSWLDYGDYALRMQLLPATFALQEIFLDKKNKEIAVKF